jgi:hypothetical protein
MTSHTGSGQPAISESMPADSVTPQPQPVAETFDPSNMVLTERYINDLTWRAGLKLDIRKYNWKEWSREVMLLAEKQGFDGWLTGSFPCPDAITYPQRKQDMAFK